ncbi:hypothetical protein DM785_02365 [Deinococcus actinosclerus]|nr:hypothetical protein DM785_02365 [Deinococcus actinosclerus]
MTAPAAVHDLLPGLSFDEQISVLKNYGRRHADPDRFGLYREGEFISLRNARDLTAAGIPAEWTLLPQYDAHSGHRSLRGYVLRRTATLTYDQLRAVTHRDLDAEE